MVPRVFDRFCKILYWLVYSLQAIPQGEQRLA